MFFYSRIILNFFFFNKIRICRIERYFFRKFCLIFPISKLSIEGVYVFLRCSKACIHMYITDRVTTLEKILRRPRGDSIDVHVSLTRSMPRIDCRWLFFLLSFFPSLLYHLLRERLRGKNNEAIDGIKYLKRCEYHCSRGWGKNFTRHKKCRGDAIMMADKPRIEIYWIINYLLEYLNFFFLNETNPSLSIRFS